MTAIEATVLSFGGIQSSFV